jgi:S1-C subfamily serine protease
LAIGVLIAAMVVLSIAGSAYWRPEPNSRTTLELGGATPVGLDARGANETITRVLDLVAPAVAFLTVSDAGPSGLEVVRSGSGVVVHEAGFVVTNAHVVKDIEQLRVSFKDGVEYDAEVYGVDSKTDLAVVKVKSDRALPVAALGDSDALRVGEFVLALGAPFGLDATATSGIVSGLHRSGLGLARYEDFIVTDAPINPGNSGGPLVNLRGEVVGINTAIIAGEGDGPRVGRFSGVGFAIPVNVMRVVAQRLIGDGGLAPADDDTPGDPGSTGGTASQGPTPRPETIAFEAGRFMQAGAVDPHAAGVLQASSVSVPEGAVAIVGAFDARGVLVGVGSGFFVASPGGTVLVTNEHVISNAQAVYVYLRQGRRWATRWGTVLSDDADLDLALVQVSDQHLVTTLELGDSESLAAGDAIRAVGARFENQTVLAALNPGVIIDLGVRVAGIASRAELIETDAPTVRGDSGGPLLNAAGEVVGVMVARDDATGAAGGGRSSYAIPLVLDREVQDLIVAAQSDSFDPGFLAGYMPGYVLVINFDPEGVGAQQGVRRNDRILAIDGKPVTDRAVAQEAYRSLFLRRPPGTTVELLISRAREDGDGREEILIRFIVPGGSRLP